MLHVSEFFGGMKDRKKVLDICFNKIRKYGK